MNHWKKGVSGKKKNEKKIEKKILKKKFLKKKVKFVPPQKKEWPREPHQGTMFYHGT